MLDCEPEDAGTSQQPFVEGPSAQLQSSEGLLTHYLLLELMSGLCLFSMWTNDNDKETPISLA